MEYKHLIGRQFKHGSSDCFGLARDFYNENWQLGIPNYARPENWWHHGLNLYFDSFYDHGFRVVTDHPNQWRIGDAVLMAIRSKVACHSGIFVEPGKILHHFIGQLSKVDDYRGLWRNSTLAVLRHKDVVAPAPAVQQIDFMELLPMTFDAGLLLPFLSSDAQSHERVGFISAHGEIVEVDNVCHDPINGFEVSGADLVTYGDQAYATWHTHPGQSSNLTFGDHSSFLNYPHLRHYIVGTDGVTGYSVANGKVIIEA